jgi:DHA2 family multidrug resistance protein
MTAGAPAQAGAPDVPHRGLITTVVMMATAMHALDATIANVALPSMQGSLSAGQDQISWVLTSYIVASAIFTPLTGFLAGRFGRRRLFTLAVTGFTIASAMCGAAQTLDQLVLFRALQGAFGAALVPLSQALLLDIYPPVMHGWAMSVWGAVVMVGPIMGPTLGGWMTDELSWRWVFYVNVPIGIVTGLGILALVRDQSAPPRRPFDLFGFALLGVALGAVQLMLDRGELLGWFDSPEIVIEALVAGVCIGMFVLHVMTADHPFIDPGLFEDRNVVIGLLFAAVAGVILIATAMLMPPFLQHLRGFPSTTVGLIMAPRGIGMMIAMVLLMRVMNRVEPRTLVFFGLSIAVVSLWQMTQFNLEVGAGPVIWSGALQGFGLGFVFAPLSTITFSTLPAHYRTEAAALTALMRSLGGSAGIAVLVALLSQGTQVRRAEISESISLLNPLWHEILRGNGSLPSTALAIWDQELTRQAAMIAYLDDFRLMMYAVIATMPLLLLIRKRAA